MPWWGLLLISLGTLGWVIVIVILAFLAKINLWD